MRFALLTCGVLASGLLMSLGLFPHYAAPITGLLFVLVLQSMRHLRVWRWQGKPTGLFIVWGVLVICMVSAPQLRAEPYPWSLQRARMLKWLQEGGEQHVVLVRYSWRHDPHKEWVYNRADIDSAKVVWAREMDADQNGKLLEYFRDRRPWLLEADAQPPRLSPYPVGSVSEFSSALQSGAMEDSVRVPMRGTIAPPCGERCGG
jgi:hypothetical protein